MPGLEVDISHVGLETELRKIKTLAGPPSRRVVTRQITKSAKRLKFDVVRNITRLGLVKTGRMRAAFLATKVVPGRRSRFKIQRVLPYPTREELGIASDDKFYYPTALEYGYASSVRGRAFTLPPQAFIRKAINANQDNETRLIARGIIDGLVRLAANTTAGGVSS